MKELRFTLIVLFILAIFPTCSNSMTKCINEAGKTTFTNGICPQGYYDPSPQVAKKKTTNAKPSKTVNVNSASIPCEMMRSWLTTDFMGITFSIEDTECFKDIGNEFEIPKKDHIFVGFLISIQNNADFTLYGGTADYHDTFHILTEDGFDIESLNTASTTWNENRMVWNADRIKNGDVRKGWIIFSLPKNTIPSQINFHIYKYLEDNTLSDVNTFEITL